MQLSELGNNPKLKIGVKQTTKALLENRAEVVFISKDAEQHVLRRILLLAEEKEVEVIKIDTMKELGRACQIDVGAATAVIVK